GGGRGKCRQAPGALLLDHNVQDLLIRLPHAVLTQAAHHADGGLYALLQDTVTAPELLLILNHQVAQESGVQADGNLAGAGCLGAVKDKPEGNGRQVADVRSAPCLAAARQKGKGSARGARCAVVAPVGEEGPASRLRVIGHRLEMTRARRRVSSSVPSSRAY